MEASEKSRLRRAIRYTLSFVSIIWLVKVLEISLDVDLAGFGIFPRTLEGSIGIFTAPFIHGDFFHLFSNTIPLILLGIGLFYFYGRVAIGAVITIYLMTGFWVWVAARDAYHIGASGIVYGLIFFMLVSGFLRKSRKRLALSFAILILYGGGFSYGFIPHNSGISWESHLMGAIAGVFCAFYFRKAIKDVVSSIESPFHFEYHYSEKGGDKRNVYHYIYIPPEDD